MQASFRELFRKLISILSYCLVATAVTGIILGISDYVIPLPQIATKILVEIHQGAFLGDKLTPFYALFIGLGVFILGFKTVIEGKHTVLFAKSHPLVINFYEIVALISVIPLACCVQAGIAYSLFGTSESMERLLAIHVGSENLPSFLKIAYILTAGISLIVLSSLNLSKTNPRFQSEFVQKSLKQRSKTKTQTPENSTVRQNTQGTNLAITGILLGSIVLLVIVSQFFSISILTVAIVGFILIAAISLLVTIVLAVNNNLPKNKQHQSEDISKFSAEEADSITMLKAIPDSILRMSQEGICLSYMPAIETKYFVLQGNIINKHITEFIEPKIAIGLMKAAKSSLDTGSTQYFRFPIQVDNEEKYHEARVTSIGKTEALILVRELADYYLATTNSSLEEQTTQSITVLYEADLIRALEITLQKIAQNSDLQAVLVCLVIQSSEDVSILKQDLLGQIAMKIKACLSAGDIFQLQENNLIVLVNDRTTEETSILVERLNHELKEIFAYWQDTVGKIDSNICLLEINSNSSDAVSLINAIQVTCQMAKQKVQLKIW